MGVMAANRGTDIHRYVRKTLRCVINRGVSETIFSKLISLGRSTSGRIFNCRYAIQAPETAIEYKTMNAR